MGHAMILALDYTIIVRALTPGLRFCDLPRTGGSQVLVACSVLPCRVLWVVALRPERERLRVKRRMFDDAGDLLIARGWVQSKRGNWFCPIHAHLMEVLT